MVSHVDIIGALTYRTRIALNKNLKFHDAARSGYPFAEVLFDKDRTSMHLWHFAGTDLEIKNVFERLGKDEQNAKLLFPCILNYQSVIETHGVGKDGLIQLDYDLAIATPVDSKWTTEQRSRMAHDNVLEPIYDEFMNQLKRCGWFQIPLQGLDFIRAKVFTTGTSEHRVLRVQYGWYVDYIQLVDLRPLLRPTLCDEDIKTIRREAELVTADLDKLK